MTFRSRKRQGPAGQGGVGTQGQGETWRAFLPAEWKSELRGVQGCVEGAGSWDRVTAQRQGPSLMGGKSPAQTRGANVPSHQRPVSGKVQAEPPNI